MPNGITLPSPDDVDKLMADRQKAKFFEDQRIEQLKKLQPNVLPDQYAYLKEMSKTWKEQSLDFDEFMERAVPDKYPSGFQTADTFEATTEKGSIQSSQIGSLGTSQVLDAVSTLAYLNFSSAYGPSLHTGNAYTLTSTLADTADVQRMMLAVCFISVYHTSTSSANLIPHGGSTDPTKWLWDSWHDWNSNDNAKASFVQWIMNNTGSDKDIYWNLHWRYLGRPVR